MDVSPIIKKKRAARTRHEEKNILEEHSKTVGDNWWKVEEKENADFPKILREDRVHNAGRKAEILRTSNEDGQ